MPFSQASTTTANILCFASKIIKDVTSRIVRLPYAFNTIPYILHHTTFVWHKITTLPDANSTQTTGTFLLDDCCVYCGRGNTTAGNNDVTNPLTFEGCGGGGGAGAQRRRGRQWSGTPEEQRQLWPPKFYLTGTHPWLILLKLFTTRKSVRDGVREW